MEFKEKLLQILEVNQILEQEPMSRHTTFAVGGPASYYLRPKAEQIPDVISLCREENRMVQVIGKGSNLLVSDRGIGGVVLEIGSQCSNISIEGQMIYAQAGAGMISVASLAASHGLTGLEFASGIPGTVGGGIMMNAGAYGGEIKDVLVWAEILQKDGTIEKKMVDELQLSYRHSVMQDTGGIVLNAAFCLKPGEKEAIYQRMEELKKQRLEKQPLEYPSAGSTFKRPEGYFAGKLIMDAGLRGYQIGGAQVSEKHCGFIINYDHATAEDILQLVAYVQKKVKEESGVCLMPEVRIIGDF